MEKPEGTDAQAVQTAFDAFRKAHGPARAPNFLRYPSDSDPMTPADGLEELVDGPGGAAADAEFALLSEATLPGEVKLWAVRMEDVVHAPEDCPFGAGRSAGKVKHSNLTGGGDAFSAGELIFVDPATIIVNGRSGRYGPRSASEMDAVAVAFRDSGYTVYSMGFDQGVNSPFPFIGNTPKLV